MLIPFLAKIMNKLMIKTTFLQGICSICGSNQMFFRLYKDLVAIDN